jgi:hypothetical protein
LLRRLFGKAHLVDPEVAAWQIEAFAWLIDHFSTAPGLPDSDLWRPVPEHFPAAPGDLAAHLFERVRRQYGFSDGLLFEPVAVDVLPDLTLPGGAFIESDAEAACATYERVETAHGVTREFIHYDDAMDATDLVATFAHELAHAAHQRAPEWDALKVGGVVDWDLYELFEADLVFATALFMAVKDIPAESAITHLKPRLSKMLNRAVAQLDGMSDQVEALRSRVPQPGAGVPRLGACRPAVSYPVPDQATARNAS